MTDKSGSGDAELRIHMSGSEWFGTRAGGLNRYFEALFTALQSRSGVETSATAFGDATSGGLSWGPLSGGLLSRTRTSRRLSNVEDVHVLDRHFAPYGPSRSSLTSGAALVTHFQGPWFAESLAEGEGVLKSRVKRWWEGRRYRESDAAVVLCAEFGEILEREFVFPADRIHVIPPGVDLDRFVPAPRTSDRPLVLCVRRLERRMGIDVLLLAWKAVLRVVPEARLTIVGDGSQRRVLEKLSHEQGLTRSVRFLGSVSDEELTLEYTRAALSVVPTRQLEGFGLIALESLASGRPVIVTDIGGLPDAVTGLDESLIVRAEDSADLANRIASALLGDVPNAAACRSHAETFSWERAASAHLELYRGLQW